MGKEIFINFFQFKERRCLVFNKKSYILATLFTCFFLGFLYLLCLWQLMQVHVFGHDVLYYLPESEYLWTITMEGRYINYLLFPLVRPLPQKFAIIITFAVFFLFFWTCAVGIGTKKASLAAAIASLLSCPLFILLQFPGTPLASYVALAFFAIYKLAYPRCDYRKFLFIAGIVFCGLYNQFYNFIPLLFLGSVLHNRIKLLHLLCWYVVCFVIGFFISEMVCYLYSGHFIEVAPWRNPQYIHSFSDLIRNMHLEYNAFWADLRIAGKWPWVWAFLCLPAALVLCFRHDYKKLSGLVKCFCVLLCVMLAVYIQALPFGLGTTAGGRTSGSLYAGLILIPFLAFRKKLY